MLAEKKLSFACASCSVGSITNIRIVQIMLVLCVVAGCIPFIVHYVVAPNYYPLTSIDGRGCYEEYAKLYLYYDVTLDSKIKTTAFCGQILHCNTSKCVYNYVVGKKYYFKGNRIDMDGSDAVDFGYFILAMIVTCMSVGLFLQTKVGKEQTTVLNEI